MGSLISLSLILVSLKLSLSLSLSLSLEIKSSPTLDSIIRDYTLKSYNNNSFKTGKLYTINLPANLSGAIHADAIRLRCGSLQRYGVRIKEFHLKNGTNINPCIERVILIRQSIESNWSSIYYNDAALSGYNLISPILTLTAYSLQGSNNPAEIGPITIDFSNVTLLKNKSRMSPLCASFGVDKKVVLSKQVGPNVCAAAREGRFGVVVEVEVALMPLKGKVSKAKIILVSSIGAALGAFLLSLLLIAMLVNAKKKARMDEMERRAYEEEALQVSMVGHVRAVTASGTRTAPTIEHYDYRVRHS